MQAKAKGVGLRDSLCLALQGDFDASLSLVTVSIESSLYGTISVTPSPVLMPNFSHVAPGRKIGWMPGGGAGGAADIDAVRV